jgi:hypothetical protein
MAPDVQLRSFYEYGDKQLTRKYGISWPTELRANIPNKTHEASLGVCVATKFCQYHSHLQI